VTSAVSHGPAPAASRRRGQVLEQAIFEAVFEQLGKVGYARLTIEGVAAASRTGKATLYRRWPDKNALIVDALRASLPSPAEVAPTGVLRADLLALLLRMRDALESSYGATFQALKAEAGPGAGLVHTVVRERVFGPYRNLVGQLLRAGVARGQVRAGVTRSEEIETTVANVGPAMLIHRYFLGGPELPDSFVVSVVDEVIMPLLRP
jgi:AcrR family transcriptional regulator